MKPRVLIFLFLWLCLLNPIEAANLWVAGGQGTTNTLAYSMDSVNWTGLGKSIFDSFCYGIEYSETQNQWVAVGDNVNTIAYSPNGTTWFPLGNGILQASGRAVVYSKRQNLWVAVGEGTDTIAYSTDGQVWTGLGSTIFTTYGYDIAFSEFQNRWVAVGANTQTIAYSPNGTTWFGLGNSIFSTQGRGVAYSAAQNRWVAVGYSSPNTIAYSNDGINWNGLGILITWGYGVDYSSIHNRWVVAGWDGSNPIIYSTNLIDWYPAIVDSGLDGAYYHVSFGNYSWVVLGQATDTIGYSTDGIVWNGTSGTTIFTVAGRCAKSQFTPMVNLTATTTLMTIGSTIATTTVINCGVFVGVFNCNCNSTTCVINGTITINMPINVALVVDGNVVVQNGAEFTSSSFDPIITATGSVSIEGGQVNLVLSNVPFSPFILASGSSISGIFDAVNANISSLQSCEAPIATQEIQGSNLLVSIEIDDSNCSKQNLGFILGIVFGVSAAGIGAALLIVFLGRYVRKRRTAEMQTAIKASQLRDIKEN